MATRSRESWMPAGRSMAAVVPASFQPASAPACRREHGIPLPGPATSSHSWTALPPQPNVAPAQVAGAGDQAANYKVTDSWDGSTYKTLADYINPKKGYVLRWLVVFQGQPGPCQPNLGAAVVYYGVSPAASALARVRAPVLGLYGGQDQSIPLATVDSMREALKRAKAPCEIHVYPDAPHAFFADYRPSYRKEAAERLRISYKALLYKIRDCGL